MEEFSDLPQSKDASDKVADNFGKFSDTPIGGAVKQVVTEMKTAFGSPQPDPEPAAPAPPPEETPYVNPKQLHFDVGHATPETPVLKAGAAGAIDGDEVDYNSFITETLMWTNKVRSTFYFIAGFLAWFAVRGVFASKMTLFTGVCYALLLSLALNFFRGVLAPKLQERMAWSGSAWTRFLVASGNTAAAAAAALHDRYLNGRDPLLTLQVGLSLWLLSVMGRALDAVTLLLLIHLGLFSVPLAYTTFKAKINKAVGDVYGQVQAQYDRLDRRIKAGGLVAALVGTFMLLPPLDRLVAVLLCLAYGRTILKPNEYAAVQRRMEPVAHTLKGVSSHAAGLAVNTAKKYDLTPTPRKKKMT